MQNVSVDNEAMAKYMSTDDVTCTASAIQNRVKKLKAMAKEESVGGYDVPEFTCIEYADHLPLRTPSEDDGDGTPKAKGKATPRKRASTTAAGAAGESPTKKAKGKGGKAKKAAAEVEDEGEEGGTEAVIKEEDNDEGGVA